jgi:hypothetical protein
MMTKTTIVREGSPDSGSVRAEPTTDATLLDTASRLDFRPRSRDRSGSTLGVLVDRAGVAQHLTISPEGAWTLSSAPPLGKRSCFLYESAANVLRGGHLDADGSISYAGGSYALESSSDGDTWTAKIRGSA